MENINFNKKYLAHIPTEQFGFISVEMEGTAEEAVAAYREIAALVRIQPQGLADKDFRLLYDRVASGGAVNGDPGIIEQLNPQQRFALNEAKKFVKRFRDDKKALATDNN